MKTLKIINIMSIFFVSLTIILSIFMQISGKQASWYILYLGWGALLINNLRELI